MKGILVNTQLATICITLFQFIQFVCFFLHHHLALLCHWHCQSCFEGISIFMSSFLNAFWFLICKG
ncbi:hypothetical protein BGX38DRAFT_1149424 [Terfezia claveryi]|nr:hypothetical protein BGX38DRAFT_1149424 [Terfezia claveryi]